MEVILKRDLFANKLGRLSKFAGDGKAIPIYANALITVKENNEMEITCGDGNTYITDVYRLITTATPGEFTVNARDLSKLVDSLSSKEDVIMKLVDNRLEVKSGRSNFKLNTISASQYPKVPKEFENVEGYDVNLKELQIALRSAKVCVAKDMTNPYLTGYKVHENLFSSDVLKICIYKENFGNGSLLISGVCSDAILYADEKEKVKVYKNANQVLIKGESFQVVSSMVDGVEKMPNPQPFIDQKLVNAVKLNRQVLSPILNRACIFTVADLSNAVNLIFKKGVLEIKSFNTKDSDGSTEYIDIQYDGEEVQLLIDGKDLIDILNSLIQDEFTLQFENDCVNIKIEQGKLIYIVCVLEFSDGGDK